MKNYSAVLPNKFTPIIALYKPINIYRTPNQNEAIKTKRSHFISIRFQIGAK